MSDIIALEKHRLAYQWRDSANLPIITGTATVQLLSQNGNTLEYLQAGFTWNAAPYAHALTIDAAGFFNYVDAHAGVAFAWPSVAIGRTVWERAIHSDTALRTYVSTPSRVVAHDEDDTYDVASAVLAALPDVAEAVWTFEPRTLSTFSTALARSVWNVLLADIDDADSIGVEIINKLDVAISTRASQITANLIRKLLANKFVMSAGGVGTLYDDDGTTPLLQWTFTDVNGVALDVAPGIYRRTPI